VLVILEEEVVVIVVELLLEVQVVVVVVVVGTIPLIFKYFPDITLMVREIAPPWGY